jgi:hypothetical protein
MARVWASTIHDGILVQMSGIPALRQCDGDANRPIGGIIPNLDGVPDQNISSLLNLIDVVSRKPGMMR